MNADSVERLAFFVTPPLTIGTTSGPLTVFAAGSCEIFFSVAIGYPMTSGTSVSVVSTAPSSVVANSTFFVVCVVCTRTIVRKPSP